MGLDGRIFPLGTSAPTPGSMFAGDWFPIQVKQYDNTWKSLTVAKIRNPLVTVDWNFIQTVPLDKCILPPEWDLLFPDEVAHEIIDKPDAELGGAEAFLGKFVRFCRARGDRVWLGFTPGAVCSRHRRGGMTRTDLIHKSLSHRFRSRLHDPDLGKAGFIELARGSAAHAAYTKATREFDELTGVVREWAETRPRADTASLTDVKWLLDFVRDPALFQNSSVLPKQGALRDQVMRFPDTNPYGVWSRLMVWYALRRAKLPIGCARDGNFSNSYADAACAFFARFTGHLLTNDRELQVAAHAVAPGVRLYEWATRAGKIVRVDKGNIPE